MTIQTTKIIEVLDATEGKTKTTIIEQNVSEVNLANQHPYPRGAYNEATINPERVNLNLTEAAIGNLRTANFPDLLRLGVNFDALAGFNSVPTVYERLVRIKPSSKLQEEYLDDQGIGLPTIVAEGEPYPEIGVSLGSNKIIRNHKRGYIISVSIEMQMADQLGKVRETAELAGRSLRLGREQTVMNAITTTTNYNVRNNNDQAGNNTQTLTFTPDNLNIALALMTTQKDLTSGQYLGVMPSILVVTPLLERFARMMVGSPQLNRVGDPGSAAEIYGGGTNNPFFGAVSQIIVSPLFGASYQWALIDPSRFIYFQPVKDVDVQLEGATMASESWLVRDVIRYKASDWYGCDVRDDRYGFYSDSTTKPAAA